MSYLWLMAASAFGAHPFTLPPRDASVEKLPPAGFQPEALLETSAAGFGRLTEELPADPDVAAWAAQLATAEAAFAFVRDKVCLQAYPGSLRGAEGTLRAGAGNSLDRASLLLTMLRHQGRVVRLARAGLPDDKIDALLTRVISEPALQAMPGPLALTLATRATAAFIPLRSAALEEASTRVDAGQLRTAAREDLRDHWWVEWENEGAWQTLDTAARDATPGANGLEAEETFDEVPEDRLQNLVFRVFAEVLQGKELHRELALEHRATVEQASTSVIVLGRTSENLGSGIAGALGQALGITSHTPVLRVGSEWITGSTVTFGEAESSGKNGAGGLAGALNALSFGDEPPAEPAAARLLAGLVLEVECEAPGTEPLRARRLLHDRLPPAERFAWENAGYPVEGDFHPLPCTMAGLSAALSATHIIHTYHGGHNPGGWAAMTQRLILELPDHATEAREGVEPQVDGKAWQDLHASVWRCLPLMADLFVTPAVNDLQGLRFYPARPRVALISSFLPDDAPGFGISVDLLHDDLRAVVTDDVPTHAVAERQLWRGALSGALEDMLVDLFTAPLRTELRTTNDTATHLSQVRLLQGGEPPAEAGIALRHVLSSGHLAVVDDSGRQPESFWEILDGTAATRAVCEPGLGAKKAVFKRLGSADTGNSVVSISESEMRQLLKKAGTYYSKLDDSSRQMTRKKSPPRARGGGNAGEYVAVTETILDSIPLTLAFTLETCSAMGLGVISIVEGLRGRDWRDRFR